jgi:two-component system, response regulator PdtaR
MRVLIADDEALIRMGLRAMLTELGHNVVGAAVEGRAALRLACEMKPDVAILDIKMPEMDGLAVAEAIAKQCPLPVILLTAYSERDLIDRAAAAVTVQAYLVKPIREQDLAPVIELAVARFGEWQALRQETASRQEALAVRALVGRAKKHLMETRGLGEQEAFLEIQHHARRRRLPMRQIAEEILAAETNTRQADP